MSISWFAGASERKKEVLTLLDQLQASLESQPNDQALRQLLSAYQAELSGDATGVPLILSRLQVELSQTLTAHSLTLSASQETLVKQLRELSQVRYG